jgi:sigma-B regulation protein RsbU (phosphoserine phosphatase)
MADGDNTESILLVDDNTANLQVLRETLRSIGGKRLIATNGEAALTIARKADPDLILLDIMMPGIDGYEVCRRLKADKSTQRIPVIFLSALDETEDKVRGLQLGAVDYISKPFQPEEVLARVNTHLTIRRLSLKVELQRDLLEHELKVVSQLQQELLPGDLPEIKGGRLGIYYKTSMHAGGDYYDIVALPGNRWGLLVTDAAGHGAAAAVLMAMTCALFRSYPGIPEDPQQVLSFINDGLNKTYDTCFVTAIFAVYDPGENTLRIARAGHPLPVIYRAATGQALEFDCEGVPPMGIDEYEAVPTAEIRLNPGDHILLYTDGITEQFSEDGDLFGEDRLVRLMQENGGNTPEILINTIVDEVNRFAGNNTANDDQALLALAVM